MHTRANATTQATTSAGAGFSFLAKKRFDMFCSLLDIEPALREYGLKRRILARC